MKRARSFFSWLTAKKSRIILAALIVVAGFVIAVTRKPKTTQPKLQTATVEKGTVVSTVSASGNVINSNIVNVTTEASGIVTKVYVKEGDDVYKGQKIADLELDSVGTQNQSQAYSSYLSAKNSLDSAQNSLYSLDSAMWAANQKFENDAVARGLTTDDPTYIQENDDWLAAEAKYKNQQNVIAQSKVALTNAWLSYQQTQSTITSPSAGAISSMTIAEGMTLGSSSSSSSSNNGSSGQRVASITKTGTPLISVNISEIDVPNVKTNQKVTVTFDSITDKTFSGKVSAIDRVGSVTSNVTNYPAIITLDTSSDEILPNMSTTANIITEIKNDVLKIPSAAISQQSGQSVVTVLKNGQEQTVTVETGISSDTETEIISGLSEGETVVVGSLTTSTSSSSGSSPFGGGFGGGGGARFIAH